ncbi:MAG: NUDIX domain-containing protein [Muribaculaceae bacterium]|nr:NUDIX domain-containing protein [Muribaculaceae bacterium]
MKDELFPIVDPQGNIIGRATRKECHSGSKLLHPVVHLHVVDKDGNIFLQLRSHLKDIQPSKWDTAVGGHVDFGENIEIALRRECKEELGITLGDYRYLTSYIFESEIEKELINVFSITVNQKEFSLKLNPDEIADGRFWSQNEIIESKDSGIFTPNFISEYLRIQDLLNNRNT